MAQKKVKAVTYAMVRAAYDRWHRTHLRRDEARWYGLYKRWIYGEYRIPATITPREREK